MITKSIVYEKKFTIKKSKIEGDGCFATEKIKSEQSIWVFGGELHTLEGIRQRIIAGSEGEADPLQVGDEEYLDLDPISRSS